MEELEDKVKVPSPKHQDGNNDVADETFDNDVDSKTSIEETASGVTENVGSDLETLDSGKQYLCNIGV